MAGCCYDELQRKSLGFVNVNAHDFTESQWGLSKWKFALYRIIVCLYWTTWAIEGVVEYSKLDNGHLYYVYLSHWNDWALAVYLIVSASVAMHGWKNGNIPILGRLPWWYKASWMIRDASIVSSYLVTIMFYSVGVRSRTSLASSIHRHAICSVLHTVDLFLSKVPVRLLHFLYPSLYFIIYAVFTLALHWSGVTSCIYHRVVDWEMNPGISIAVLTSVVVIICPLLHSIAFLLYHIRIYLASKLGLVSEFGRGRIVSDVPSDDDIKDGRSSCDSNV